MMIIIDIVIVRSLLLLLMMVMVMVTMSSYMGVEFSISLLAKSFSFHIVFSNKMLNRMATTIWIGIVWLMIPIWTWGINSFHSLMSAKIFGNSTISFLSIIFLKKERKKINWWVIIIAEVYIEWEQQTNECWNYLSNRKTLMSSVCEHHLSFRWWKHFFLLFTIS